VQALASASSLLQAAACALAAWRRWRRQQQHDALAAAPCVLCCWRIWWWFARVSMLHCTGGRLDVCGFSEGWWLGKGRHRGDVWFNETTGSNRQLRAYIAVQN
jgi:hypothetical protein